MSQNHFTLSFPLKSPVDAKALAEQLPPMMPQLFHAADTIGQHVDNPPASPVANNADAFVEWTAVHLVHPLNLYTAYPDVTAKEIKALASAADVTGAGEQRPFLVILPIKSSVAFVEIKLLLLARGRGTTKDLDKVGTPHFPQFLPLKTIQIRFLPF